MGALEGDIVVSPIQNYLERLHKKYARVQDGVVASYIPELAIANPDWFGICLATIDGHVYEVGDTSQPFTIQSISKPLVYGLALEDRGREVVLNTIGVEPTGDAFNSISLAPDTGCPLNPMINAGAIAATSLVAGHSDADKLNRILEVLSLYAGHALAIDHVVYASERATGHRNRAIGHMLRNFEILTQDPESVLNLYFQQCSISVDCRDLSLIAASLANGGVNPVSGERAVRSELVENILSVMTTCGMYDNAGQWVYRVGMPAKSGVAGGIMAVLPGQVGIGVFSPPLDARGNSLRGVRVCEELSRDLHLHFLSPLRSPVSVVRSRYSLAAVRSKRRRTAAEGHILDVHGSRIKVYELQGNLRFSTVEAVIREIIGASLALTVAIIDLRRVPQIDAAASHMLIELVRSLAAHGKQLLFTHAERHLRFKRLLEEAVSRDDGTAVTTFPALDLALEWCEAHLLTQHAPARESVGLMHLSNHQLCKDLKLADVTYLKSIMVRERFNSGELIIRQGEVADKLYFLMRGEISVLIELPSGRLRRLATVSPGMGFGESALVDGGVRSADVRADKPVECYSLTKDAFERLAESHAELKIGLLRNLLRAVTEIANRMTEEVMELEG